MSDKLTFIIYDEFIQILKENPKDLKTKKP